MMNARNANLMYGIALGLGLGHVAAFLGMPAWGTITVMVVLAGAATWVMEKDRVAQ